MNTEQKIIQASIRVFTKNGYLGSSTKVIANEAGVSEMTLFRKFQTKQNLFETMLQYTLIHELTDSSEISIEQDVYNFTKQLLHNRLLLVSKHIDLVRMIIQESLQGRLPIELDYVNIMSNKLSKIFVTFFEHHQIKHNPNLYKHLLSIVLHYTIVDANIQYHQLDNSTQERYTTQALNLLKM